MEESTLTIRALSLLRELYAATTDPARWPRFLGSLEDCFSASGAVLTNYDTAHEIATFALTHNVPMTHLQDLIERAGEDPRGPYNLGQSWHPGLNANWHPDAPSDWMETWDYVSVSTDRMFCTTEFLHSTNFYREVLAPLNIEYSAGLILQGDRYVSGAGVFRPMNAKPFSPQDIELLHALAPHIRQAIELHRRFATLHFESESVAESLNQLEIGIVILDEDGLVLFLNETALGFCAGAGSVRYVNNRFEFQHDSDRIAFAKALAQLKNGEVGYCAVAPGEPGGIASMSFLLSPASVDSFGSASNISRKQRFIGFITRPVEIAADEIRNLRGFSDLTLTETRVLAEVLNGIEPKFIGAKLGIAEGTVRTHIKHIYQKTGTNRQNELIVEALKSPEWILSLVFGTGR